MLVMFAFYSVLGVVLDVRADEKGRGLSQKTRPFFKARPNRAATRSTGGTRRRTPTQNQIGDRTPRPGCSLPEEFSKEKQAGFTAGGKKIVKGRKGKGKKKQGKGR